MSAEEPRDTGPVVAPATMRLRAEAPRVTRISRKAMITLGMIAGVGIGGALIFALQGREKGGAGEELVSTDRRTTAEGLQSLPGSYGDVPLLGPPLPGDLGGPILRAQQEGRSVPLAPVSMTDTPDPEEMRRLAELEAARTSQIFFQTRPGSGGAAISFAPGGQPSPAHGAGEAVPGNTSVAFLNASTDRLTVAPDRITSPASPYLLQAGSVIPAALITGIRSDLPGQITAQVTQNVYDSPTGALLLIPQGTRVIGEYDDGIEFGQRRVLLVWTRMIFPNGRSIVLERLPGADAAGYAGLEDGVDHHWGEVMKAAGLATLLAFGAELAADEEDVLARTLRDGAQDTINQVGQRIVERQLQVEPTLTIRPGFPARIMVTRDLVLEPYGEN